MEQAEIKRTKWRKCWLFVFFSICKCLNVLFFFLFIITLCIRNSQWSVSSFGCKNTFSVFFLIIKQFLCTQTFLWQNPALHLYSYKKENHSGSVAIKLSVTLLFSGSHPYAESMLPGWSRKISKCKDIVMIWDANKYFLLIYYSNKKP